MSAMSSAQISQLLTQRARKGASPETLYNLGFTFFYQHGFSQQEMAASLAEAYRAAKGVNDEQNRALERAAVFWETESANWESDVIPDQELSGGWPSRGFVPLFYSKTPKVKMFKPGRR